MRPQEGETQLQSALSSTETSLVGEQEETFGFESASEVFQPQESKPAQSSATASDTVTALDAANQAGVMNPEQLGLVAAAR